MKFILMFVAYTMTFLDENSRKRKKPLLKPLFDIL